MVPLVSLYISHYYTDSIEMTVKRGKRCGITCKQSLTPAGPCTLWFSALNAQKTGEQLAWLCLGVGLLLIFVTSAKEVMFSPLLVGCLVGLSTGLHKNYYMDFH